MRATSDQHISIYIDFYLKHQSKEASAGNIKNKLTTLMTNKLHRPHPQKE